MPEQEVKQIIVNENLQNYNWFNEHNIRENEVIIYKDKEQWVVCASDERANVVTQSYMFFEKEEEAFSNFTSRLCSLNRLLKKKQHS